MNKTKNYLKFKNRNKNIKTKNNSIGILTNLNKHLKINYKKTYLLF